MFKSQLAEVRQQGVAYDRGEYNIDVFSIGAPIFNHVKKPIAAISVCAPAYRMKSRNESDLVSQLKKTAAEISAQLFYKEKKE
jgi:DNA-binding IclR family transcriptional regulator